MLFSAACTKTAVTDAVTMFLTHGWSYWYAQWAHSLAFCLTASSPAAPPLIAWLSASYPAENGFPSKIRAAVFVLPNSIPFQSFSVNCLFWCSYTLRPDWAGKWKHLPDFKYADTTTGSGFLQISKGKKKGHISPLPSELLQKKDCCTCQLLDAFLKRVF